MKIFPIFLILISLSASDVFANTTPIGQPTLMWCLDDVGTNPKTKDATDNNHFGITSKHGNIKGGAYGAFKTSYDGFTNVSSYIACTNLPKKAQFRDTSFSVVAWIKAPELNKDPQRVHLLARGASKTSSGGDVPWQLWIDGNGAFNVSLQDWTGHTSYLKGDSLDWRKGAWYMVAFVCKYEPAGSRRSYKLDIYRTKKGDQFLKTPIFSESCKDHDISGLAAGNLFIIGAGPNPFKNDMAPAGYWGAPIDQVTLWLGKALNDLEIQKLFKMIP